MGAVETMQLVNKKYGALAGHFEALAGFDENVSNFYEAAGTLDQIPDACADRIKTVIDAILQIENGRLDA